MNGSLLRSRSLSRHATLLPCYTEMTSKQKARMLARGGKPGFLFLLFCIVFKADRLQMIVVAKKYICVATVHQYDA